MRLNELKKINEGGVSSGARYNSELAVLLALSSGNSAKFNPMTPEKHYPKSSLLDSGSVYDNIKKFLPANFNREKFIKWYDLGLFYKEKIKDKLDTMPTKFTWAAGSNKAEDAADVGFVDNAVAGVSIKDEGGITLANLTPAALGLEGGGDVIARQAKLEFNYFKTVVFNSVLDIAEKNPNKLLSWHAKASYHITYVPKVKKFVIVGKGGGTKIKTVEYTRAQVLANIGTNDDWQRPFGDWCVANFGDAIVQKAAKPLITKVSSDFEKMIEKTLVKSDKLANMLRFSKKPYFYLTAKNIYYVPSLDTVKDLKLKRVYFAEPDGWTLKFIAEIGRPDSETNAKVEIHIRYANGMFACNPTARIQDLRDPQFISWEKL
jgi:hypothetical protein